MWVIPGKKIENIEQKTELKKRLNFPIKKAQLPNGQCTFFVETGTKNMMSGCSKIKGERERRNRQKKCTPTQTKLSGQGWGMEKQETKKARIVGIPEAAIPGGGGKRGTDAEPAKGGGPDSDKEDVIF